MSALPVLLLVTGCDQPNNTPPAKGGALQVAVSIQPQAYLVDRVGGERVKCCVLVGPGQSPATFDPSTREMAELASSSIYFRIGVPFENRLMEKIASRFDNLEIIDTRTGLKLRHIEDHAHKHHDHEHEHGHQCTAGAEDPHTWLNPLNAAQQARTICEALKKKAPEYATDFESNLETLLKDLESLNQQIKDQLAPIKGGKFFVFHPAFGYFADAYGLEQLPIESGGKEPSPRQLTELISRARALELRVILVQEQFSTKSAEAIARAIEGKVLVVDPLARDYIANLKRIAAGIADAAKVPASPGGTKGA